MGAMEERCLSFAQAQIRPRDAGGFVGGSRKLPFFTFSREAEVRGESVANALADRLNSLRPTRLPRWEVIDRDLVARALEEHGHSSRLAAFLPEARVNEWMSMIEEIVGLHPSTHTLFELTCDTIHRLAAAGNVILVGRGANFVTSRLADGIHVRLIGDHDRRMERLAARAGLSRTEAERLLRRTDSGRRAYVSEHFSADVADPHHYDITFNTDRVNEAEIADALLALLRSRLPCRIGSYPVSKPLWHESERWQAQEVT